MSDAQPVAVKRRHIPAIDGLRGIAVAGVLLFHDGRLTGGFLGVDMFFALSGFLITSLLIEERERTGGVRLGAFWERRARRLLPAVLAFLVAIVPLMRWFGTTAQVDIIRLQPHQFGQSHAGAIEQLRQQALLALKQRQHPCHLGRRQHHRQARRPVRPADGLHPRQVLPEHLLVEEEQRRQRLPVRGHRHLPVSRQPRKKGLDLGLPHLTRVAHAVEAHEGAHPMDVGLLGP